MEMIYKVRVKKNGQNRIIPNIKVFRVEFLFIYLIFIECDRGMSILSHIVVICIFVHI